ncbi:PREDICTED: inactive protein RESTRICTED TEV MOVEMENT 2-like [Lupinus angustifolius]|uniref:inactive protein RESTRICTED TEV MOVEMENT 2-like n=1 Tax=Lupinus angustifolius TaxID=3871 RepID=UPI00092E3F14|nr:PREDICTED: inactive protein RESTRICTED TEV MOVEMENT 2-like [Lupinus angustifolius]
MIFFVLASDFRKEEVNLQVDSSGSIIVRGDRKVNDWKSVHFQLIFPVPEDSDADKIAGKFDAGILYVTAPKQIARETKESEIQEIPNGNVERAEENENQELNAGNKVRDPSQDDNQRENEVPRNENADIGEFSEQLIRKWEQDPMLRNAVEVLRKNKGIVITAVIAFSLGILVSHKFQFSSAP